MPSKRQKGKPASDDAAARYARRCVDIVASLLRPEEIGEAVREFTLAIREEMAGDEKKRDVD